MLIFTSPLGSPAHPFFKNQIFDALEWILKDYYGLAHVIHILHHFFIVESSLREF